MFDDVNPVVLASGFRCPEGPSFDRSGVLYCVDWEVEQIYRVTRDGQVSVFVTTPGEHVGSKFHPDGRLFVASGERGILAIAADGTVHEAATAWAGGAFRGTNDLCFRPNGDLYFTDPKGSSPDRPIGNVFILRRTGDVELFASGFQFPNGLVFSDDRTILYLAETFPNRIWAFEVDDQGHERSRRVFAQLEGGLGPDGMALGQDGNLYVAHYGKGVVAVVDPAGQVIAELPAAGKHPTNVAFWDRSLYVTEVEHGQVVRLDIGIAGQVLYGLGPLYE